MVSFGIATGSWFGQVNVGGTRVGASVSLKAPYDPTSERIRT